jgi:hypothetical protein
MGTDHKIQSYSANVGAALADGVGAVSRRWRSCCRTQRQVCAILAASLTTEERDWKEGR